MGLSFKDSLENNKLENLISIKNTEISNNEINKISEEYEVPSVMAYSLRSTPMIIGEDEGWIKIENQGYRFYDNEYKDEEYSAIDELKNISLNQKQFNITQEKNSQYIPFKMPRFYDGFDLKNTRLSIYYVNENKDAHSDTPVDVYYNDNGYIRFAWLVSEFATQVAGVLKFEIHADGTNSKGEHYTWKSKPIDKLNVLQSLENIAEGEIGVSEEELESWYNRIQFETQKAEQYASNAQTSANEAIVLVAELQNGITDEVERAVDTKVESVVDEKISEQLLNYYTKAETYDRDTIENKIAAVKPDGYATVDYVNDEIGKVNDKFGSLVNTEGFDLTVEEYVRQEVEAVDVSDELGDLTREDGSARTVKQYVDDAVAAVDVSEQLKDYAKINDVYNKTETYNKDEIDNKLKNVTVDLSDYATKTYVDGKDTDLSTSINTNTQSILGINSAIATINQTLDSIDKSPNAQYITTYNQPFTFNGEEHTGENTLALYEIYHKDQANESKSVISYHTITGGSGGATSSNTITIDRVTPTPYIVSSNDKVVIDYIFTGLDASKEDIQIGYATWKIGNKTVINKEPIYTSVNMPNGFNSVEITDYIGVGSDQKVTLFITDDVGTMQSKTWYVSVIELVLESNFDDTKKYASNSPVDFTFNPRGAVDKTVHFLLDGEEIGSKISVKSATGLLDSYTIPSQEHGSHLLEVYMTATINDNTIESNHIFKDILWFDDAINIPVIGTIYQDFTARQYDTTNIVYTVYDPSTETPTVEITVNDDSPSILTLEKATNTYTFKTDIVDEHIITITCGETVKTIKANIVKLNIDVLPVTTGLAFDFNPAGKSNNDTDRTWTDGVTTMSVSDNFDWVNGGYQYDENGDQYFCVKSGTTATINYNLFTDDAKTQGKEFKVVFKTTNIKNRDTTFISCMNSGIGLDMKVQDANVYSSNGHLYSPYCEEDIIEFEFNVNTIDNIPLVMTYEDGVGCRPMIYTSDSSFWQSTPQPITIGSDDCDVHIYRMKAYTRSLSDSEILSNFILDARNADEMVNRYNRNQIYEDKDGIKVLTPEGLAEACPDLRVIIVDAPWFTNDKDDKVSDTTISMIYKNGRPEDNWTCTGALHSGQGTSSNEYGYAGRNIDLIMNDDISLFKWTNENGQEVESKTITLTESSVPTNYINVKVNIASSENQNNAQFARRYNEYNPFIRSAKFNDNKVKDCMEFYNCVIFVRERNEDISTHREFQDCEAHFYAIGNVGDSKKSDNTRVNDKNDPKEFVVEIADYNVKLAEFPTGYGKDICAPSDWKSGNFAYDYLYADYKYKDGKFKSFGSESYEFRYEMKGITEEQREVNINAWRDMYKFVVTSTNEEFHDRLNEYFVVDSALYYYLFTERYTMVDNRAKNSFWHYGKVYITEDEAVVLGDKSGGFIVDDEQSAINDGYRFDLTFFYDADTALGIDNTGKLVLPYGKEDSDYYIDGDPSSTYVYRAAESTFFCRLRDLFKSELQAMFVDRESKNAWSANGLIKQWDNAQNQFPEELWRLDIQRKYLRTYLGTSIDNSIAGAKEAIFLPQMMNGRKKYQRRMFERNQELYMATKYFGTTATQDQIRVRFNNPESYVVKPNFTLHITPYSDMYIGISFYNGHKDNFRAKAGVEYQVNYPEGLDTADITLIYGASFIQAIGDLSKCYIGDNDFTKATRLQSLVIGSDVDGYANSYMTEIKLANNRLLEYLDVRNVTGLSSTIDLSQCGNMLELRAEGSGAKGVIFANGGKIKKFYLPSITSLTAKNLNYVEDFNIESYINLQTLVVENTPAIDTHEIVDTTIEVQSSLPNDSAKLNVLRLIGIDWNIDNADILDDVVLLRGQDNNGGEIDQSVLSGKVHVPTIKQKQLEDYREAWSDLDITYDDDGLILQHPVTFVNYNGEELYTQYVDEGGYAIDPVENGDIPTPTRESTISTDYTYVGWNNSLTGQIWEAKTITAQYSESIRKYTIKYVVSESGKETVLQESVGEYGTNVPYTGKTPTYDLKEGENGWTYYLFNRWDKSGFIDGDKTVTAIFDICKYTTDTFKGKELSDLSPVEIYALTKLTEPIDKEFGDYGMSIETGDDYSFTMGYDVDYDDIDSTEVISEKRIFSGIANDYYDTGIKLFDEDKDFVLALDYKMSAPLSGTANATLMQCYQTGGTNGFKLSYTTSPVLAWGGVTTATDGTTVSPSAINNREMLVIRHKKGDNNLYIYTSNLNSTDIKTYTIARDIATQSDVATLVFGAAKADNGRFANYAVGEINWCKIWYKDLGESTCRNLVCWTHEKIKFETSGFHRYQLYDDLNKESMLSLLATHLLSVKGQYNANSNNNTGGWKNSKLNSFLNSRFYNAIPYQIKALIKKIAVKSTIGDNSSVTDVSGCYVNIPALYDVYDDASNEYKGELYEFANTIDFLTDDTNRVRDFDGADLTDGGVSYWLRSPSINSGWGTTRYCYRIDENGSPQAVTGTNTNHGILIEISF